MGLRNQDVLAILGGLTKGLASGIQQRQEFDLRERELQVKQDLAQSAAERDALETERGFELKERGVEVAEAAEERKAGTARSLEELRGAQAEKAKRPSVSAAKAFDTKKKDLRSQLEDNAAKIGKLTEQLTFAKSSVSFATNDTEREDAQLTVDLINEQISVLRDSTGSINADLDKLGAIKKPKQTELKEDLTSKIQGATSNEELKSIHSQVVQMVDQNKKAELIGLMKVKIKAISQGDPAPVTPKTAGFGGQRGARARRGL